MKSLSTWLALFLLIAVLIVEGEAVSEPNAEPEAENGGGPGQPATIITTGISVAVLWFLKWDSHAYFCPKSCSFHLSVYKFTFFLSERVGGEITMQVCTLIWNTQQKNWTPW